MLQSSIMGPCTLVGFSPKYNVRPASWLECNCDAADLILPCPKSCTFAFSYASCLYSPAQREFFTCWWCCSSWAFPSSSRRNYTLKSQVQVVIQTIKSETGLLICYMQICKSASSSEEEVVIGWRHLEDQRKIIGLFYWKHLLNQKTFLNWHSINLTYKWSNDLYVSYWKKSCLLLRIGDIVKNTCPFRIITP